MGYPSSLFIAAIHEKKGPEVYGPTTGWLHIFWEFSPRNLGKIGNQQFHLRIFKRNGLVEPPTRQNEENSQPTRAIELQQKEMLPAVNEKIQTAEDEVEKAEQNQKWCGTVDASEIPRPTTWDVFETLSIMG